MTITTYSFGEQQISQLHKMVGDNLKEITSFSDQVVKRKKNDNPFDTFLSMLEGFPLEFDEDSNPNFQPLINTSFNNEGQLVGMLNFDTIDELQNVFSEYITKEHEKRLTDLIEKKREHYYASKRNRRLSYID